tara:strand:- start:1136 stop:1297 length:162 start_codon:yes stop_codon:yes gene_type:complete
MAAAPLFASGFTAALRPGIIDSGKAVDSSTTPDVMMQVTPRTMCLSTTIGLDK